ncbi:MAG: bacteriohemerythrin [Proteobacteria bacterium]|nr:bacteriohemerythrin [Pseudomonadota bacterium]
MSAPQPVVPATADSEDDALAALAGEFVPCAVLEGRSLAYASAGLATLLHWRGSADRPAEFAALLGKADRRRLAGLLATAAAPFHETCALTRADGTEVTVALECVPARRSPRMRLVITVTDLSDWMRDHARLQRVAFRDALTGLASRALVYDRIEQAIAIGQRADQPVYVLLLDLDRFKPINDALGHAAGDAALRECAHRILQATRRVDTVGRLGGDEFVVLLGEADGPGDAARVAQRILDAFEAPIGAHGWRLGVSIGIAAHGPGAANVDQLLACADEAMYAVKAQGGGRYALAGGRPRSAMVAGLPWSDALQVGVAAIDAEHERLVAAVNRLAAALRAGAAREALERGLAELVGEVEHHFGTEEAHMRLHPYPGAAEHRAEHGRLLSVARSLLAHVDEQSTAIGVRYLADWLPRHIQTYDAELGRAVRR